MSTPRNSAVSTTLASGSCRTACSAAPTPAGSTCTSRSTTTHGSPTPSCCRANAKKTGRLPHPCGRLVCRPRHHRRTGALRQRAGLPLRPVARHLRRARHRTPLHAPLLALDKREGRSADQDAATRMGLPLRLPHQHTPQPRPRRLHQVVQPTSTARLARRPTANQPRLTPLWSVHLGGASGDNSCGLAVARLSLVSAAREAVVGVRQECATACDKAALAQRAS